MDGVQCPICGAAVPMRAQQTGGYGSRPNWVFEEHGGAGEDRCAASGRTASEAAGD